MGFEYGFNKPLHVVETTPADWENPNADLREYIAKVNAIKKNHPIFLEESSTQVLHSPNPNILLMWKGSVKRPHEALLILNKDPWQHQEFYTDSFRRYTQSRAPLRDVSPEYPLDYIPEPYHYALRPGQGIVLVTSRS
jgi:starch synthase (maltosyl-transferring)